MYLHSPKVVVSVGQSGKRVELGMEYHVLSVGGTPAQLSTGKNSKKRRRNIPLLGKMNRRIGHRAKRARAGIREHLKAVKIDIIGRVMRVSPVGRKEERIPFCR